MTHQENAPLSVTPGAIRFNTDSMKLEYYRGGPVGFGTTTTTGEWVNLTTDTPDIQTGGARGVFMGGAGPGFNNIIDYITISSTGDALDFGDLTQPRGFTGQCASSTRGVAGGGQSPTVQNTIDFVTIASTGDAQDFGDLFTGRYNLAACGSNTRGLFGGGNLNPGTLSWVNTIEYITIASTGDAIDYGDLIETRQNPGSCSSSTRAIWMGGEDPSAVYSSIDFTTIATLGNAADFGDLTSARKSLASCSNSIRGISGGGGSGNIIDYITIATLGDAIDFGDLSSFRNNLAAVASSTRGVFGGGQFVNVIEYVQIMSTGDAIDFGDLISIRGYISGCSNGHGGLG